MPKTKLGKWSVWCAVSFVVLLIAVQLIVASGQEGGETFFDNLLISIPMLLTLLAGVLAFILGLTAIIMHKERSVLVYIVTFIGLLVLAFVAGEIFGGDH